MSKASRALTLLLLLVPAGAQAADNLDCIDVGYSEAESASLFRFVGSYGLSDWKDDRRIDPEIEAAIVRRVKECANKHDWSYEAIMQAISYKIGEILWSGLDQNTVLEPGQMAQLRDAYSNSDKARLIEIMRPAVDAIYSSGFVPPPSDEDTRYLNEHITGRAGLPITADVTAYVGAWLLTQGMMQIPKDRFSSL